MNLRTALLVATLTLASTALRAEEFQMAIQGVTCPQGLFICQPGVSTTLPFTATADLNSVQGTVSATSSGFGNVVDLAGSVPLTNYTEIVGGHATFFGNSSLSFNCFPFAPTQYECNGNFGGVGYDDNELWMGTVTQVQFQAFKDPLASLLSMFPTTVCSNGGVSSFCQTTSGMVAGSVTFSVPAPGPLPLSVAGLVGLVLSWRRKRLSSLLLPS